MAGQDTVIYSKRVSKRYKQCVTIPKGYGEPILCTFIVSQKNNDKKNSFDSHPYPAGTNRFKCTGRSSDSSHLLRLPSIFTSGKDCNKLKLLFGGRDTQQQELLRIRTGFPFHPSASKSWLLSSLCTANVCDIFSSTKQFIKKKINFTSSEVQTH